MIETVGYDAQSQCLGSVNGFGTCLPIHQNARKFRRLGQPAAIFFLFDLDVQAHEQPP